MTADEALSLAKQNAPANVIKWYNIFQREIEDSAEFGHVEVSIHINENLLKNKTFFNELYQKLVVDGFVVFEFIRSDEAGYIKRYLWDENGHVVVGWGD